MTTEEQYAQFATELETVAVDQDLWFAIVVAIVAGALGISASLVAYICSTCGARSVDACVEAVSYWITGGGGCP